MFKKFFIAVLSVLMAVTMAACGAKRSSAPAVTPLLDVCDDTARAFAAQFEDDQPTLMRVLSDDASEFTVLDAEKIGEAFEALKAVKLGGPVDDPGTGVTIRYTFVMSDGTEHAFSFINESVFSSGGKCYSVADSGSLFSLSLKGGVQFFEMYLADTGVTSLASGFANDPPVSVAHRINGSGSEGEYAVSRNAAFISKVFDALSDIIVDGDSAAPASGEEDQYLFTMKDGTEYLFTFDSGCLEKDGKSYVCENTSALFGLKFPGE